MSKRNRKKNTKIKISTNFKFIIGLTVVGLLLIVLSQFERKKMSKVESKSVGNSEVEKRKSFQPSDPQKDLPGKLLWGRDF